MPGVEVVPAEAQTVFCLFSDRLRLANVVADRLFVGLSGVNRFRRTNALFGVVRHCSVEFGSCASGAACPGGPDLGR